METYRRFKDSYTRIKTRNWSYWWKLPRLGLYIYGIVSYFWYFWCVAGLVIGILYFLFFQEQGWKRNGIFLAFAIAFVNLFVFFYKAYSPLNLVIWSGLSIFPSYLALLAVNTILKRKTKIYHKVKARIDSKVIKFPKKAGFSLKFIIILIPNMVLFLPNLIIK